MHPDDPPPNGCAQGFVAVMLIYLAVLFVAFLFVLRMKGVW